MMSSFEFRTFDRKDRVGALFEHLAGCASQDHTGEPFSTMGSHDDKIAVAFFSVFPNLLDRIAPLDNNFIGGKTGTFLLLLCIFTELMRCFFNGQMFSFILRSF